MASEELRSEDRVLAFIDLGTNSIRMSIVRIKQNQTYTILREEKEIVRLGEQVFVMVCSYHSGTTIFIPIT
nr:hypothetical protein BSM_19080 [uncultured archaeon]